MDQGKPPAPPNNPAPEQKLPEETSSGLEDMLRQLSAEMSRSKPTDEKVLTAIEAAHRVAFQMDAARSVGPVAEAQEVRRCPSCGSPNPRRNRFCARCGVPLQAVPEELSGEGKMANPSTTIAGEHHYHHHYHHHYFASSEETASEGLSDQRAPSAPSSRDTSKTRSPARFSRTETALRQLAQDWATACNTKHLDELVGLYASDAMVVRPNVPPVRSAGAIRELLFSLLEAGLGEVHMEPLRVEIFGEIAYEVGRCTMLMPTATGKRREERGKYVMVIGRQAGEWKILVDSWSTDLSLEVAGDARSKSVTTAVPKGT